MIIKEKKSIEIKFDFDEDELLYKVYNLMTDLGNEMDDRGFEYIDIQYYGNEEVLFKEDLDKTIDFIERIRCLRGISTESKNEVK